MNKSKCRISKNNLLIEIKCERSLLDYCKLKTLFSKDESTHYIYPYELTKLLSCLENKSLEKIIEFTIPTNISSQYKFKKELRDYQLKLIERINENGYRGTILLPTGAGKTIIALKLIEMIKLPTLIVVPTIALLNQWKELIKRDLLDNKENVGAYYSEEKSIKEITVTTYKSASTPKFLIKNMEKFGLVIFDEVHNLLNRLYIEIPLRLIAPYRIGLTSTIKETEYNKWGLNELIGEIIKGPSLTELELHGWISEYNYKAIPVKLTRIERELLKKLKSKKSPQAKKYIRKIIDLPSNKLSELEKILKKHKGDRVIVFTRYKESAREISKIFGIPLITSSIPVHERLEILKLFSKGEISKIVSAEVLDEGLDVPEANVAIIISGRDSNRQLVQRIGRVIRPKKGNKAYIYELYTKGTYDEKTFKRRQ